MRRFALRINNPLMIFGSPGAGKTVLASRTLVRHNHQNKRFTLIFDPIGSILDAFIDGTIPERVMVCDMSARQYCVSFPLLRRYGDEALLDVAQRFPEVLKLADPAILAAPIAGYNPLLETTSHIGILLFSMNMPLTVAPLLLKNPEAFRDRINEAVAKYPQIAPSVNFVFKEYKASHAHMFQVKILPFLNDASLSAICCSTTPGIDWQKASDEGYTVFLDFRHVTNEQKKSFLLLWTFKDFQTYIRTRPVQTPVSLVIDELKAMFLDSSSPNGDSAVATEVIQLLDVYARNFNVNPVCLISQDPLSFGPKVVQSLLAIPNQIVGMMNNTDAATLLASHLFTYFPTQHSTLDKDAYTAGQLFKQLKPFHFLVRPSGSQRLYRLRNEPTHWVDRETIERVRTELIKRSGRPIQEVLDEIAQPEQPKRIIKHDTRRGLPEQDTNEDVS